MENVTISDEYAIVNASSSKGVRQKFYIPETNIWFKQDLGIEEEISNLLVYSSISDYVKYKSLIVNNKPFCSSCGFLATGEEEITFARIIEHMTGKKVGDFVFGYREIRDRFVAVTDLIQQYTSVNVVLYVKTLLYLDILIGNPDRHFNNMAMIHNTVTDSYYPAPIFDNGAALSKENPDMCGNFGGKHEYVLASIGKINSPIRFDYDEIDGCPQALEDRLLRYEDVFRYTGKMDIKEYGRKLVLLPPASLKDGEIDYVEFVESSFSCNTPVDRIVPNKKNPSSIDSAYYEYKGKTLSLRQVARETSRRLTDLRFEVKKYGFEEAFDAAYLGITVRDLRKPYKLLDGSEITKYAVCEKLGVDIKWLLALEEKKGTEYVEKHLSDSDLLTFDDSHPAYLNIPGYKFTRNELAHLLNVSLERVDVYSSDLSKLLKMYHFEERLLFKDKAHDAIWMSDDIWKYTCPKCGKKLILTTNEVKKHVHSDEYCKAHEL